MSKEKILIVDDEPGAVEILEDFLSQENYKVETARDGEEALSILKESAFDLVLTDLNMPKLDGLALLDKIQKMDLGMMTIVLTGWTLDGGIDYALPADTTMAPGEYLVVARDAAALADREGVLEGKRVAFGGRRNIKKKK